MLIDKTWGYSSIFVIIPFVFDFWLFEEHYGVNTISHISGLYVSRNTYIRAGVAEWKVTNPVHLVNSFFYVMFCYDLLFIKGLSLYKMQIDSCMTCMHLHLVCSPFKLLSYLSGN